MYLFFVCALLHAFCDKSKFTRKIFKVYDLHIVKHGFYLLYSRTVDGNDLDDAMAALEEHKTRLGYQELHAERNIAKLSIVGAGMMSNPGVAAKMFESLYNEGVNINMISTSEIRVTVLINEKDGVRAMNAVHDAFNLAD